MNSKIINRELLIAMLEENGVKITLSDGKVTSVSTEDRGIDFSYSVTNGELSFVHLTDDEVEILFDENDKITKLVIVHGRTIHVAEVE